jgi:hypothetical protein
MDVKTAITAFVVGLSQLLALFHVVLSPEVANVITSIGVVLFMIFASRTLHTLRTGRF